ncbi:AAA family ATPase [Methanobacterium formicicum]|uniref:Membrane protein n=1 Tax=Methanobacterium formicicum TaxID=2162 RepID=A0A0S4FN07_METFO|nr:AAA family ATPase [Methanobacterium formicicum]CEL24432.1 putative membrane protein [Methanobacterium formicicum]
MREVLIPNKSYIFKENGREFDSLNNLTKVNVLIGANNNGKSQFLRALFFNELFFETDNDDLKNINNVLEDLKSKIFVDPVFKSDAKIDFDSAFNVLDYLKTNEYLKVHDTISQLKDQIEKYSNEIESYKKGQIFGDEIGIKKLKSEKKRCLKNANEILNMFNAYLGGINLIYPFLNIYIPVLRGLRPLCYSSDDTLYAEPRDVYAKRTIVDYFRDLDEYFPEIGKKFCVFTGLKTYNYIFNYMHDKSDRKQDVLDEYEDFLCKYFFDGQNIKIRPIQVNKDPDEDNQKNLIKIRIGDEEGKLIYELGDGIQSIITMTFPLFLYKGILKENETVQVFIEELELHIHPGLQKKLLETFVNYDGFKNFQFFITTHSSHLLDVSFDLNKIAVFSFDKKLDERNKPKFIIENRSINDVDVLELLGARSLSAFSNCMIFVEGYLDRLYLKKYFDIFQKKKLKEGSMEFLEDYHYSFFEYHGNNIDNSFLLKEDEDIYSNNTLRLKNSTFVLMDGDKKGEERADKLKDKLGDRFKLLSCKAIENLISDSTIIRYLIEEENYKENELNDFEESEYQTSTDCDLIDFITNEIVKDSARKFQVKKSNFCYNILNYTDSWEDLSELTIKLCEDLYKFVETINSE